MEESKAHQYYQEMKNAGSGAAQFKQGLGWPTAQTQAQPAAAAPSQSGNAGPSLPAAPARAPLSMQPPPFPPGQRPPPGFPPPPGLATRPPPPGMRPPGFPPPPVMMPPRGPPPPQLARPPYPMPQPPYMHGPPPPGYRPPPPPGYYAPQPGVAYPASMRPPFQRPPYPFPSPPQPLPLRPSPPQQPLAQPPYMPAPQQLQQQPLARPPQQAQALGAEPGGKQAEGEAQQGQAGRDTEQQQQRQREEEERRRREEEQRQKEEEEKRQRAVAEAWSAYKSEGGSVYYYNTTTGESSWDKPEGFVGDADKASANPVPVSSEKIKGTEWLEVVCDDGKKYYYHGRTAETSWQVPPEVEAKLKVKLDPVKAAMLERVRATGAQLAPEYQAMTDDAGKPGADAEDVSFTEDDIGTRAPQSTAHTAHPPLPAAPAHAGGGSSGAGWGHAPPASAAQPQFHPKFGMLPAVPPPLRPKGTGYGPDGFWSREEAVEAFKELLGEKGIHAFSRWERELAKLQPDERFKFVPASERRAVFEEFCKEAAGSRAKPSGGKALAAAGWGGAGSKVAGAAAAAAAAVAAGAAEEGEVGEEGAHRQSAHAAFEELLDEIREACSPPEASGSTAPAADADGSSVAVDGGDGSEGSGKGGGKGGGAGPLVRWDERLTLDQLESFWGADPRWRRCSAELRQQLFDARIALMREAAQKELEDGFRALLKEQGVTSSSRWSRTKEAIGKDGRCKAVPRDQREALFRQYTAELQAAEDAERRQQEQRAEREREAQRKLEAERRAAEQRQRTAAHADAVANYKALLTEVVRDCDVGWREMQPRLAKDAQGRASNPALERGEGERLFRDHVQELLDAANEAYLDLLDAVILPLLPSKEEQNLSGLPLPLLRFKDVAKMLDEDPRFHRLPTDLREVRWRRYVDDAIFNRDYPKARQRTQRRAKREVAGGGGGRGEEGGAAGAHTGRRPREEESGGIDKAYAREYLQADKKRPRRE